MGQFNDDVYTEAKQQQKATTITLPIVIEADDVPKLKSIVEAQPENLVGTVTGIVASSGNAEVDIVFVDYGATADQIKRILREGGLTFSSKRPTRKQQED